MATPAASPHAAGSAGTSYYVTVVAQASTGYLTSGTSPATGPQPDTSSLSAPTNLATTPSVTTVGAITATFTSSTGAAPSSYTATTCTNAAMTTGCSTHASDTSGTALTGLTAGTSYYTTITAVSGSAAYVSATTSAVGPAVATTQLTVPTNVTLAYGTVAGSVGVTFTAPSNAAPGQTYTVQACTNAAMTTGCVASANLTSGSNLTGLAFSAGNAGTSYYVTVAANAASGYLGSGPSSVAGPQADTSQLAAPGTPVVSSSTTVAGAITAAFAASSGSAPASYTAMACSDSAMTLNCRTQVNYVSGAQFQALISGTSYYVQVTAVTGSAAFVSATSATSGSPALATTQLLVPTITSVASSSTTAAAITIVFTGSTNAPGGQTYTATACTNVAMTTGCVTVPGYVSGVALNGLGQGTSYYVTLTAAASPGYLAITTPVNGPVVASSQLATPTTPVLAYGASAGSINVTTSSSNAPSGETYTIEACTNAAMTTGCVSVGTLTSGSDMTGLAFTTGSPGTTYYLTAIANAANGYLASQTSAVAGPQADTSQLAAPGRPTVAPSTTTAGAISATFTGSTGTAPASYTATACTNAAMTAGCVSQTSFTSGSPSHGADAGDRVLRLGDGDPAVGGLRREHLGGVLQLRARDDPAERTDERHPRLRHRPRLDRDHLHRAVERGWRSDLHGDGLHQRGDVDRMRHERELHVRVEPHRPRLRTGLGGDQLLGDRHRQRPSAYLAATSTVAGPQDATSQLAAPGTPTVASSTTTAGAVTATFASSTGVAPASYSAKACTNAAMTTGCVTLAGYTSGAQLTGLVAGTTYFVQVTAVPGAGFTSATSAVSSPATLATVQLAAPTITSVTPSGTTTGAITIAFTGSSNAPGGQTYTATACTNAAMTTGCLTQATYTSGAQFSGLSTGTSYWRDDHRQRLEPATSR